MKTATFRATRTALGLVTLFVLGSAARPVDAALVAYYSMNDGSGTALADRYNSARGTLTNMTPASDWVTGHSGAPGDYALDFDGSNDFVTMGALPSWTPTTSTPFSVQAWVFDRGGGTTAGIFGAIDPNTPFTGWGLNRVNTGKFRIEITPSSGTGFKVDVAAAHSLNQWHHVVATYDGSGDANGFKMYLNGVAAATTTVSNVNSVAVITPKVSTIGSYGGVNRFFNGQVDDVALWNHTLSPTEVQQLYQGGALFTNPATQSLDISSKFNRDTLATAVLTEPSNGGYRNNGDTFITTSFVQAGTQIPNVASNGVMNGGGSEFQLGNFDQNNTWILGVNQTSTLSVNLPPLVKLAVLFTGVGYNPTDTNNGTLTITFSDNTTEVFTWDLVDSQNFGGMSGLAQIALSGMDLFNANTDLINAVNGNNIRSWYYQVFELSTRKTVTGLTFSTVGVGDSANDANWGIYGINYLIVPEPSSLALWSMCAAGAAVVLARRRSVGRRGGV